ncbi:light-harvesting complex-like protein OHP1, chloroplastic [Triticum dicoccoides]|uniref:light-harvesting complex-like protein OHP1, chloroplastic n=1 Tax=Triticum dicoccoides TaxID=85692 RepID=UPI0018919791|nr:light-harvesting complex-like protein OHP1, chloroplastic [Triticum dicoccoides]
MAVASMVQAPSLLAVQALRGQRNAASARCSPRAAAFRVRAAKLPAGVQVPRAQPKLSEPFLGFTKTAEVWNSRACMMGLIGTFIVELILNKGVLEIIGFEVGKGLDIPL